jgi:hypothetical protein
MGSRKKPPRGTSKPTFASVTSTRCTCKYLERASEEPDVPIVFDAEMNEFHIKSVGENPGYSMIYHCPWCGGVAPTSKRASLFARVTNKEEQRLRDLTRGATTLDDVISKFGKPDHDMHEGLITRSRESDTEPSKIKMYRTLHYLGLSTTADVHFTDFGPDGGVRATFQGKYLGAPKKGA